MEKLSLKYLVKAPEKITENTPLLILFHGYGSNEEDLFSFATELPNNMLIISARAPQQLSMGGYAWYTIHFTNDLNKFSDIPEAIKARETIATFINELQKKYQISPEKTFLLGFSQGAILSYSVAFNYPEKAQKIIALSGYINTDLLPETYKETNYSHLDFFVSHGSVDQVIPVQLARKSEEILSSLNIEHIYQEYPVGHGVAPQNFYDFKKWIEERI